MCEPLLTHRNETTMASKLGSVGGPGTKARLGGPQSGSSVGELPVCGPGGARCIGGVSSRRWHGTGEPVAPIETAGVLGRERENHKQRTRSEPRVPMRGTDRPVVAVRGRSPHRRALGAALHPTVARPQTMRDGTDAPRERGTPQGSPISPLLANLFMHYAFDKWMDREHSGCAFERYGDEWSSTATPSNRPDNSAPTSSGSGPWALSCIPTRRRSCTAKDTNRRDEAEHTSFDFLGYTFRGSPGPWPTRLRSFSPAMSPKAKQAIGEQIRDWHLNRRSADLAGLARAVNARIRGWFNYYGAFYRSELYAIAARIDEHLVRWAMQKFKRLRGQPTKAWRWLDAARQREPQLFAHWHLLASTPRRTVGAV